MAADEEIAVARQPRPGAPPRSCAAALAVAKRLIEAINAL